MYESVQGPQWPPWKLPNFATRGHCYQLIYFRLTCERNIGRRESRVSTAHTHTSKRSYPHIIHIYCCIRGSSGHDYALGPSMNKLIVSFTHRRVFRAISSKACISVCGTVTPVCETLTAFTLGQNQVEHTFQHKSNKNIVKRSEVLCTYIAHYCSTT